jgi:HEAT repeat protein
MFFADKAKKIEAYAHKRKSVKIAPLLQDKKKEIRLAAIKALGTIGDDNSVNGLIAYLSDPDPEIRTQVAHSMGTICKDVCKTHLQYRIQSEKDEHVLAAIRESIASISASISSSKR